MASCQSLLLRFKRPHATIATTVGCCLIFVFLVGGPAHALDPTKRLTQYVHTSWRIRMGPRQRRIWFRLHRHRTVFYGS